LKSAKSGIGLLLLKLADTGASSEPSPLLASGYIRTTSCNEVRNMTGFLSVKEACRIAGGKHRATLWRWCELGLFPRTLQIGPQSAGYIREEVDAWVKAKIEGRTWRDTAWDHPAPDASAAKAAPPAPRPSKSGHWFGAAMRDATPGEAERWGWWAGPKGAVVASVDPGSPAAITGLQAGDIITSVEGRPAKCAGEVLQLLGSERRSISSISRLRAA
jgi:predicted DNA-binding transcriptional regulator AlpA